MLLKLTKLHLNPPPAASINHSGVARKGYDGMRPMVSGGIEGRGLKTTNLTQLEAMGHGKFGGEEVGPMDSQLGGAFPDIECSGGS